jgi:hypothetical protein
MSAPLTDTTEIAKRAYERMRAILSKAFGVPWDDLDEELRAAFVYMVCAGGEAAVEMVMLGNAGSGEGAACH